MADEDRFTELGRPRRIWAIGAIHGDVSRLVAVHDTLLDKVQPGDRLVYLGNYGGPGGGAVEVVDELLAFRRHFISLPGILAEDVVYLRGAQEEMWQKLLQIQFAPDPGAVFAWVIRHGIESTLKAYGSSAREGFGVTRDNAMTMTRWTNRLRSSVREHPGHEKFMTMLRRAAFTRPEANDPGAVLFVHSGLDPERPLSAQKDSFWWSHAAFNSLDRPYESFTRIVRGADPTGAGVVVGNIAVTLDGGSGYGGTLIFAALQADGAVIELLQA